MKKLFLISVCTVLLYSCGPKKENSVTAVQQDTLLKKGTFAYDLSVLKQHKKVIVLGDSTSEARVAVIQDYQARIITSTAAGEKGNSYGWINYAWLAAGKNQPHMNPVGGEDRFWLGPEGGQYSVFFQKGSAFDFEHWQTPALIDTMSYDLVASSATEVTFRKHASLENYHGYTFALDILRKIKLLNAADIEHEFGLAPQNVRVVAFESDNSITNRGKFAWSKKTGLLSIWILGMYNPSEETTIVLPHKKSTDPRSVTDNYFGSIPAERIIKSDSILFLKGDGMFRCKVGIAPAVAKNMAGSYDPTRHLLTLIKFDLDPKGTYVNSKWEVQKEPYRGDVANSYNDGPLAGGGQIGPFYELESSSPARELKPGEALTHRHITLHLEGDEAALDVIARKTLGVSIAEVKKAFGK